MPIILGSDLPTSSHSLSRSRTIPLLILQFLSASYLELWIIISLFDTSFGGSKDKGPLSVYVPLFPFRQFIPPFHSPALS